MAIIKALQPLEWEIDLQSQYFSKQHLHLLELPEQWRQAITNISRNESKFSGKQPPIRSLHITLQQAFDEIICIFPSVFNDNDYENWLLATKPIPKARLRLFISAWLTALSQDYGEHVQNIAKQLDYDLLSWRPFNIGDVRNYQAQWAIPSIIAHHLVASGFSFTLPDSTEQKMVGRNLLISQSTNSSTELITWIPETIGNRAKYDYSYRLEFYSKPHIDRNKVRLLMSIGIRRWVTTSMAWEKDGKLRPGIPYSHKKPRQTAVYFKNSTQNSLAPLRLANYGHTAIWVGYVYKSLENIVPPNTIVDPMLLLNTPSDYQEQFLVVYSTQMTIGREKSLKHSAGAGVELADRLHVYNDISEHLPDGVRLAEEWQRAKAMRKSTKHPATKSHNPEVDRSLTDNERLSATKRIAPFTIELHVPSNKIQMWNDIVLKEIGCDANDCKAMKIRIEQCAIPNSVFTLLDEIAEEDKKTGYENAVLQRIGDFNKLNSNTSIKTGVIVEMPNYSSIARDPKEAVRIGLARTGRVSQFITPESDNDENYPERVRNAVRDILRQLGYMYDNIHTPLLKSEMPDDLDIIAIQMLDRRVPVVVHAIAGTTEVDVYLATANETSYYQSTFQARLALTNITNDFKLKPDDARRFFQSILSDLAEQCEHPLVLLDGDKLSRVFPDLRRKHKFINITGNTELTNIRVARIAFSDNKYSVFGVPIATITPASNNKSFSGLFADPHFKRKFYSFRSRPATQPVRRTRHRDNPRKNAWHPHTMQIDLLNLQEDDIPVEWAYTVRNLCEVASHFNDPTKLPEPLHTADNLNEYLIDITSV